MLCPFCEHPDHRVVESRVADAKDAIRRRRECGSCGRRFTTFERVQLRDLVVLKKDNKREPFDRAKLERAVGHACRKRDISQTTLEPPLGSGPYRIKEFVAARSVVLERVKDYWGANVPSQVGTNNFDQLRFEFFRDNLVALEAFKADQADWISENSAKQWATAYDFPAIAEKRVVREEFPINDSGRMQGFVLNLRREKFKDARLRRAFNYAYDFEEMNKQIFFGQYKRIRNEFTGVLTGKGLNWGG